MPQKPITYYAQTTAVNALCQQYGSHWQDMPKLEALTIAAAIATAIANAESDALNMLTCECSIPYLATCDGFRFQDHNRTLTLLEQLDTELDSSRAANLVIGIYSNINFLQ
ncbi:MAG: hypothetical protein ACFB2W_06950 [Leptolyngbyaceae cyanobacterium]